MEGSHWKPRLQWNAPSLVLTVSRSSSVTRATPHAGRGHSWCGAFLPSMEQLLSGRDTKEMALLIAEARSG